MNITILPTIIVYSYRKFLINNQKIIESDILLHKPRTVVRTHQQSKDNRKVIFTFNVASLVFKYQQSKDNRKLSILFLKSLFFS